jgi:hypothetical protein
LDSLILGPMVPEEAVPGSEQEQYE